MSELTSNKLEYISNFLKGIDQPDYSPDTHELFYSDLDILSKIYQEASKYYDDEILFQLIHSNSLPELLSLFYNFLESMINKSYDKSLFPEIKWREDYEEGYDREGPYQDLINKQFAEEYENNQINDYVSPQTKYLAKLRKIVISNNLLNIPKDITNLTIKYDNYLFGRIEYNILRDRYYSLYVKIKILSDDRVFIHRGNRIYIWNPHTEQLDFEFYSYFSDVVYLPNNIFIFREGKDIYGYHNDNRLFKITSNSRDTVISEYGLIAEPTNDGIKIYNFYEPLKEINGEVVKFLDNERLLIKQNGILQIINLTDSDINEYHTENEYQNEDYGHTVISEGGLIAASSHGKIRIYNSYEIKSSGYPVKFLDNKRLLIKEDRALKIINLGDNSKVELQKSGDIKIYTSESANYTRSLPNSVIIFEDKNLKIWNNNGELITNAEFKENIVDLILLPNNKIIIALTNSIKILINNKQEHGFSFEDNIIAISLRDENIIIGFNKGILGILDVERDMLDLFDKDTFSIDSINVLSDGRLITTGSHGDVKLWR